MISFIMYTITIIVFATISAGVYFLKKNTKDGTLIKKVLRFNLSVFVPMVLGAVLIVIPQSVSQQRKRLPAARDWAISVRLFQPDLPVSDQALP